MDIDSYLSKYKLHFLKKEELKPYMQLQTYEDQESIIELKEALKGIYFVVYGKVRVYMVEPNGKSLLFRFQNPCTILGDVEVLTRHKASANVDALGTTHIIFIRWEGVDRYLVNNPEFLRMVILQLSDKLFSISHASSMNLTYPVIQRYASYLVSVTDPMIDSHIGELHISDNRTIASLLGTSYRHLNRVIKQLIEEGTISKEKYTIHVINRQRLLELSEGNIYE